MKAAIVYWSRTGNTAKVAEALRIGLERGGAEVTLRTTEDADDLDWYAFDLVCAGAPSYRWRPPRDMDEYLSRAYNAYRKEGRVRPGAPHVPGKHALVFCTYSGPHTGIDEATPVGKVMAQYFAHLGFQVVGEWYVVGEFHGSEEYSTLGRLGDIRGRPNQEDLDRVERDAEHLARELASASGEPGE